MRAGKTANASNLAAAQRAVEGRRGNRKRFLEVGDLRGEWLDSWIDEARLRKVVIPFVLVLADSLEDVGSRQPALHVRLGFNVTQHQAGDKPRVIGRPGGVVRAEAEVAFDVAVRREHHNQRMHHGQKFNDFYFLGRSWSVLPYLREEFTLLHPGSSIRRQIELWRHFC